jgi:hypothetical protein
VEAYSLGHDLTRGVAGFRRSWTSAGKTAEEHAAAQSPDGLEPGDDEAAALAGDVLTSEAAGPADEEMFDDSAIEALAQEADSVTTTV